MNPPAPNINPKPINQYSKEPNMKSTKFFIRMLAVFFTLVKPASTNANPGCMKNTSIALQATSIQYLIQELIHQPYRELLMLLRQELRNDFGNCFCNCCNCIGSGVLCRHISSKTAQNEYSSGYPQLYEAMAFIFCIHNNYLILYLLFISDVVNLFINVIIRKETWERAPCRCRLTFLFCIVEGYVTTFGSAYPDKASSIGMTKIRPSPISPVCAALMIACTVFSIFLSRTTIEIKIRSMVLVSYTTPR